jgi:hypothetical protein
MRLSIHVAKAASDAPDLRGRLRPSQKGDRMIDPTAIPLEAQQVPAQLATSWAYEAKALAAGLVYTSAVAAVGTLVVIVAIMVGVVTAPLLLAGAAYAVVRYRRRERLAAPARSPSLPG